MHWPWKNCLSSWAGYYASYKGEPTIVLEGVATYDLWFCHAYFGSPRSNNDLNVLNTSPLFDGIFDENAPKVDFQVGGGRFDMGYYLADGIYPKLSTIVQAYKKPTNPRQKCFTKMQEGARKDVERAFGVLQAKWHIVRGPVEYWDEEDLKFIMLACVILHNMIIEHERRDGAWRTFGDEDYKVYRDIVPRGAVNYHELKHEPLYNDLRLRLTNHVWDMFGNNMAPEQAEESQYMDEP
ncbi:protein ALP1-like [Papaver somniferum]|uniref:protein ALP1-like n=1 Tax=Papaver somniferum TaxID=3469 RepID=UPI000E6F8FB6|nr:protein ALP1-like [Papaver somniferum]